MKTRLISIVSKPIKVVVVVIVVVSVKKNSPNNFWSKNKSCPKNFRPKSVGSKKIWVEKKLGPKKFWSKKLRFYKFRSKKTLCPKKFLFRLGRSSRTETTHPPLGKYQLSFINTVGRLWEAWGLFVKRLELV